MNISDNGLEVIQDDEGCRLYSYLDTGGVWTIGVGHTGPDVVQGMTATMEQVLEWLRGDTAEAQETVNRLVTVPLTQNQFDALVNFVFNIGEPQFASSTLLKKLNKGDYEGAGQQFLRWDKDNGRQILGLLKRRIRQKDLFGRV